MCRGVNEYDPGNDSNEQTFSGDRILVSKFDYVLSDPKRWDVFVFKFPEKARMNYIKRLVGLPGEQLLIREGDVYINHPQNEEWDIARKPPHKIRAMRQIVSDTRHLPGELVKQGWPSPWQPWDPAGDPGGWKVEQTEESWTAELASSQSPVRLRYFHK
ncbi:MAG: signal peptidase I, partial [Planctomycetales bacterium]|nr:signal peptidase I [Planctomycetales bacterium]